jgi:hypothetical protein
MPDSPVCYGRVHSFTATPNEDANQWFPWWDAVNTSAFAIFIKLLHLTDRGSTATPVGCQPTCYPLKTFSESQSRGNSRQPGEVTEEVRSCRCHGTIGRS